LRLDVDLSLNQPTCAKALAFIPLRRLGPGAKQVVTTNQQVCSRCARIKAEGQILPFYRALDYRCQQLPIRPRSGPTPPGCVSRLTLAIAKERNGSQSLKHGVACESTPER
jgi:hypothetical protein